jgi:predicted amidophosphoribosyltransferase
VCGECRDWPDALTAARHAFVLGPPTDDLVHALKYEGWRELAGFMGDALARLADPPPPSGLVVVVPVPTTPERLRARGYNQAGLLAERVASTHDLPLSEALVRVGASRSQTALTPAERRENVRGDFAPSPGPDAAGVVRDAHVLLVDDVLTTGATASEAASVLADMGARTVTLLTFGRAVTAPRAGRARSSSR